MQTQEAKPNAPLGHSKSLEVRLSYYNRVLHQQCSPAIFIAMCNQPCSPPPAPPHPQIVSDPCNILSIIIIQQLINTCMEQIL